MPRKEPLSSEWEVKMTRGVEHHFNHSLDLSIGWLESADIEAKTPGNRGPHLLGVEPFPFDLAALEHVRCQGLEHSLLLELEAECLHAADQPALLVAHGSQACGESSRV